MTSHESCEREEGERPGAPMAAWEACVCWLIAARAWRSGERHTLPVMTGPLLHTPPLPPHTIYVHTAEELQQAAANTNGKKL